MKNKVLPPEWAKQSFVQLTWPHADSDWAPYLQEAEHCYLNIAEEVLKRQDLIIVTPEKNAVRARLKGLDLKRIRFVELPTNDTWARDHGGITLLENGNGVIHDFKFNGWALKFSANYDNLITQKVFSEVFAGSHQYRNCLNFVLEGGAIESDGQGTLLTTTECLMSPNRNGGFTQTEIEAYLIEVFGLKRVLWLNHGYLAGDDTDSHIDTLARFCSPDTIAYVRCDDENDEHYIALKSMERELKTFTQINGKPYNLVALPMADKIEYAGERLPATYANFLIINGAVLVPTYGSQKDQTALSVINSLFPDREVVGIDCSVLIKQHGSLHCVTMQYPQI
ncbi:MAG: agmatine deiminase family protein [Bacteroidota bacterium]|nr:MAG: agmatine deiminase family protein [Bacteroidota bacterium]